MWVLDINEASFVTDSGEHLTARADAP